MRKIKKINGYLVVRFNDREKRLYEGTGLGAYGVIEAESYTGHLDIDRHVMEYDDADTLEEAVRLARDLEAEVDIQDEPTAYTVVVEGDDTFSEEQVEPQPMIDRWGRTLADRIGSCHYPDTDGRTAAHALYGYKVALYELGLLPDDGYPVSPGTSAYTIPDTLSHGWKGSGAAAVRRIMDRLESVSGVPQRDMAGQGIGAPGTTPGKIGAEPPKDGLDEAERALEHLSRMAYGHSITGYERDILMSGLSTFGRLLEKERYAPDPTCTAALIQLATGLYDGSLNARLGTVDRGRIEVDIIDTIRRTEAGHVSIGQMGGTYYIRGMDLIPP